MSLRNKINQLQNTFFSLVLLLLFASCDRQDNKGLPVAIKFDYNKGFNINSLKLTLDKRTFSAIIDTIYNQKIEDYSFLPASKGFKKIYDHSELYINNVISYLGDSLNSKGKQEIALLTMLHHNFSNNLNFLCACDYLYKKNFVDEQMLLLILFPPVDLENRDIVKYYKNIQIKNVLNDIIENPKTSSKFKATLLNILTGKSYQQEKDFLAEQYNIHL